MRTVFIFLPDLISYKKYLELQQIKVNRVRERSIGDTPLNFSAASSSYVTMTTWPIQTQKKLFLNSINTDSI